MTEQNEKLNAAATDLETVRARVKERLRVGGHSQRDLEERAGWSVGYLSKLLNGDRPLKSSTIQILAIALDELDRASCDPNKATELALVEGTFYASVLIAGDDIPTDALFARTVAELDAVRAVATEAEVARALADQRATEAEERLAALQKEFDDIQRRAADLEVQRSQEEERATRLQQALEKERDRRERAERDVANLKLRVDLPTPQLLRDDLGAMQYAQALRNMGITDWQTYARYLERDRQRIEAELAQARQRPGWGTTAFSFLAGVGLAAASSSAEEPAAKRKKS